jgi:hypothetical protein
VSFLRNDKTSNRISKFPNLFLEALTIPSLTTTPLTMAFQSLRPLAEKGEAKNFYLVQNPAPQKDDFKNTGYLPLPKHPQFTTTASDIPATLALT